MHVDVPCTDTTGTVSVSINVVGTFNGAQSYSVDNDNMEVASGTIDGSGTIDFKGEIVGGTLSFDLNCKDAQIASQAISGSTDSRKLAFKIAKISFSKE